MKTLERKYMHSTHLISIALLQLAPVPLLPGTHPDPTGHQSATKTAHCPFAMDIQAYVGTSREKNPNNSHRDKTGHYFSFNNKILCRWCCYHLWGKQEQSILLTEDSMSRSARAGWELPFLRTHHLLQHHLQHHFNYVSVLQGWQLSQCTGEEMRHFWGSTALINTPDACLVREKLRHLAVLTWSLCETMARNML